MSCDGDLSISVPNVPNYGFARSSKTNGTYIHHTASTMSQFHRYTIPTRSPHVQFIKRTMDVINIDNIELRSFSFLAGPTLISDYHQKGGAPRCWGQVPFGLISVVKPGAREAYFNGCGAENGIKVPDFRFEDCCNTHDLCYGNHCQ